MNHIEVLVIGRSCLDYIAVVNQFPVENQKLPLNFRITEGGGQGGTSSCCISRLGGRVSYVGKLGNDDEGKFCLKRLDDFGVDTRFVEIIEGVKTPVAYVFITTGSGARSIIYERNTLPGITFDDRLVRLVLQSKIVLLDPESTYLGRQLKTLTDGAFELVYDCERWRDGVEDIMNSADYFIPSSEFLEAEELHFHEFSLYQRIIKLNEMVSGRLVVTHGEKGAYYITGEHLYQVAAPEVKTVDTVGAGDNFHAAFALARARGFDLHQSVKFAVSVASLSCREYGGRNGVPDWKQAQAVARTLKKRVVVSIKPEAK